MHKVSIVATALISYVRNVVFFYESEELNVCTRCRLLLLLGSHMLETWWFLWIRETECVHEVSTVAIALISYVGNVVVFVVQRN